MKTPHLRYFDSQKGFTLLELMVVIAIIAVLFSITVAGVGWYREKTKISTTEVLIKSVGRALDEYKLDNNGYPSGDGGEISTSEVYAVLYGDMDGDENPDSGATVYLPELDPKLTGAKNNVRKSGSNYVVVDGWKNPLRYQSPGEMNPEESFDLWSLGKDGKGGPDSPEEEQRDDVKNW